jgi:uncharacterized protein YndB with AHSA1/START domain
MARTRRSRALAVPRDDLWAVVSDPYHLPRWWPRVARVEAVDANGFTEVLKTEKGRNVRADFRFVERREPELLRWTQEVAGTPFEPMFEESNTEIRLEADGAGTRVTIMLEHRMRGLARFGGFFVRRPVARQIDAALDGLERLHD